MAAFGAHANQAHPHSTQNRNVDKVGADLTPDQISHAIPRLLGLPDIYVRAILVKSAIPMTVDDVRSDIMSGKASLDLATRLASAFRSVCPPESVVPDIGIRHVMMDERKIRREARALAEQGIQGLRDTPPDQHTIEMREASDERRWRRRIRRAGLDAQAHFDAVLRLSNGSQPFVSGYALGSYKLHKKRCAAFNENAVMRFADQSGVSMSKVIENGHKSRIAAKIANFRAMQQTAEDIGFVPISITVTLPGSCHPRRSYELSDGTVISAVNDSFDSSPREQHDRLQTVWKRLRARIAKRPELRRKSFGFWVVEPHEDGTPHMHILYFMPSVTNGLHTAHFIRDALDDLLPGHHACTVKVLDGEDGPESHDVARYMMKYQSADCTDIDFDTDPSPQASDIAIRTKAWARARGIRTFGWIGLSGSLSIIQRIRNAKADEVKDWPERARSAWQSLQDSAEFGRGADAAMRAGDTDTHDRLRTAQSRCWAETYKLIGALKALADGNETGVLKLTYETGVSKYGRTTRRAVGICDSETGECIRLSRQKAKVIGRHHTPGILSKKLAGYRKLQLFPLLQDIPILSALRLKAGLVPPIRAGATRPVEPPDFTTAQNDNPTPEKIRTASR